MMSLFICKVCGHIEFGEVPEKCPVCGAPKSSFSQDNDAIASPTKEGHEKHVPVLVKSDTCGLLDGCKDLNIKIGSTTHPMQAEHWINWIDVYIDGGYASRYEMSPKGVMPAVGIHFKKETSGKVTIVAYCNKHGYWQAELQL